MLNAAHVKDRRRDFGMLSAHARPWVVLMLRNYWNDARMMMSLYIRIDDNAFLSQGSARKSTELPFVAKTFMHVDSGS